jgi:hypothetical protein
LSIALVNLRNVLSHERNGQAVADDQRCAFDDFGQPLELIELVEHHQDLVRLVLTRKVSQHDVVELLDQQADDGFDRAEVGDGRCNEQRKRRAAQVAEIEVAGGTGFRDQEVVEGRKRCKNVTLEAWSLLLIATEMLTETPRNEVVQLRFVLDDLAQDLRELSPRRKHPQDRAKITPAYR